MVLSLSSIYRVTSLYAMWLHRFVAREWSPHQHEAPELLIMTHCQTSALMMARWFRLSGSYAGSFQAAQSGGDWGFTFDKVLHSWDLSGPLGYQGIHHMILLFIHSEWDESYQIAHHLLTQLSNENTVSAVWGAQTQMLHCNVGTDCYSPSNLQSTELQCFTFYMTLTRTHLQIF